jgi:integrase
MTVRQMLTDTAIRKAGKRRRRYKLSDQGGLYLAVLPSGKKVWRYEYRLHGRRETLTFGTYSDTGEGMSLAEARKRHAAARHQVEDDESPARIRRKERQAAVARLEGTFQSVAERWYEELKANRGESWARQTRSLLVREIYPVLGELPIVEIEKDHVLKAAKKTLDRGSNYTAERIRQVIALVFDYAILHDLDERNPARDAQGTITVPRTREYTALTSKELRRLLTAVREHGGRLSTRIALELLALTFVRKNELLHATWDEIDFDVSEWRIPAARMKMGEAHIVPLSTQSLLLFKRQKALASGSRFIFPSLSSVKKPLSDTALNNAIRRLGWDDFSPHGFRRTASTMLNEQGWSPDVIERQLAHKERNRIRAAYNKATYLPERKQMMQAWADYVDAIIEGGNVVPIRSTRRV